MKIKLSRSQWEEMGKKAGWRKEALLTDLIKNNVTPQVEPTDDLMHEAYGKGFTGILAGLNMVGGDIEKHKKLIGQWMELCSRQLKMFNDAKNPHPPKK